RTVTRGPRWRRGWTAPAWRPRACCRAGAGSGRDAGPQGPGRNRLQVGPGRRTGPGRSRSRPAAGTDPKAFAHRLDRHTGVNDLAVATSKAQRSSLYLCYLGLTDPLTQTQVVAYLEGLTRAGYPVVLLTFEPRPLTGDEADTWRQRLGAKGI